MNLKKSLMAFAILPLGILLNQPIEPVIIEAPNVIQLSKEEVIAKYSEQYGTSSELITKVMMCESGGNPNAVNNNEPNNIQSFGIMQFQKPSFDYMSSKMGEQLDFYSYHDQIKLASWAISNNMGRNWSCYRKVTGK
jgi:hypothetical protein